MEFTISQEIKNMIEKGKQDALFRCVLYGHDFRNVDGIEGNKICVCCGCHPNQNKP